MTKIYGIKDCANLTLTELGAKVPYLYSDYANMATNEWSAERQYATEKGTNAISWDSQKKSTIAIETEVFDLKFLAMANGTDFVTGGGADIKRREIITVNGGKATLTATPMAKSTVVLPVDANGLEKEDAVQLTEVELAPASATEYKIASKVLTFESSVTDGTQFVVYFVEQVAKAKTLTIKSDVFPKAFELVADVLIREKQLGKDEFCQIVYPNVRPQPNFTLTMSATEITKLSITFDIMPVNKVMAEYKIIE